MKSVSLRGPASYIVVLAAGMTLFASQPSFANSQARQDKRANMSRGTNNGGGGGAILCPGKEPMLTDYWELAQSASYDTVKRLEELRKLSYQDAFQVFVKNMSQYFNYVGEEGMVRNYIDELITGARRAISEKKKQTMQDSITHIWVDRGIKDPKDSGIIDGLVGTDCHEERVIVSKFQIGSEQVPHPKVMIVIRNPELFMQLPPYDQIGLIVGHELPHAFASGNTGRLQTLGRVATDSVATRRLSAWIALATSEDFRALKALQPRKPSQIIVCSPYSVQSERPGYTVDRMQIIFQLQADRSKKQTVVELKMYKDEIVWLPTFATLPMSADQFLIPKGVNTNRSRHEIGRSFDLEIKFPFNNVIQGEFKQIEPDITGSKLVRTGMTIQVLPGPENKPYVRVENETGKTDFYGEMVCYRKLNPGEKEYD